MEPDAAALARRAAAACDDAAAADDPAAAEPLAPDDPAEVPEAEIGTCTAAFHSSFLPSGVGSQARQLSFVQKPTSHGEQRG